MHTFKLSYRDICTLHTQVFSYFGPWIELPPTFSLKYYETAQSFSWRISTDQVKDTGLKSPVLLPRFDPGTSDVWDKHLILTPNLSLLIITLKFCQYINIEPKTINLMIWLLPLMWGMEGGTVHSLCSHFHHSLLPPPLPAPTPCSLSLVFI